ncbi:MAG TPA: hypothetical protein VIX17_07720 [Pyrinomonadaceae bacterium]
MTRWTRRVYSPKQMDQGVSYEKVFDHKKKIGDATALQGTSSETTPAAAGESIITFGSDCPDSRRIARNNNELLKEQK